MRKMCFEGWKKSWQWTKINSLNFKRNWICLDLKWANKLILMRMMCRMTWVILVTKMMRMNKRIRPWKTTIIKLRRDWRSKSWRERLKCPMCKWQKLSSNWWRISFKFLVMSENNGILKGIRGLMIFKMLFSFIMKSWKDGSSSQLRRPFLPFWSSLK